MARPISDVRDASFGRGKEAIRGGGRGGGGGGGGGGKGGFSPSKFSDRSDDDMLPYINYYMYSINMSNVPGVLPWVHLSTVVYSYSRSASLTSLLHLTTEAF